jgi:hypothetical protein
MIKKGNPDFKPMSDSQREEVRLKRIADQEYAKEHLNVSYADEQFWREKASDFSIRLPMWWKPASDTKYVRRACKKLGIDINDFISSTGFSNLNQLVKANSKWTALGMVGLCIEFAMERG